VKAPTIRYYEQIGLLPAPPRSQGNRRLYEAADLRRLAFIRHARELGFEIEAIRALLTLQDDPGQPCARADGIAKARLAEVKQRIGSLTALKAELELMVEGCRRPRRRMPGDRGVGGPWKMHPRPSLIARYPRGPAKNDAGAREIKDGADHIPVIRAAPSKSQSQSNASALNA
jgi:DNA-binding transcriptional MerR regulator